jgi:hypothetical protein
MRDLVEALQLKALELCPLPRDQWQIRVRATQITTTKLATDSLITHISLNDRKFDYF